MGAAPPHLHQGGDFRRRKSLGVKRCRACGNVLHQLLVDAGETYHAGCYPPADLREQVEAKPRRRGRAQEGVPVAAPELDLEATS